MSASLHARARAREGERPAAAEHLMERPVRNSFVKFLSVFLALAILAVAGQGAARAQTPDGKTLILGAGSTFAAPLYDAWIRSFVKASPSVSISYDAVGSGEGINRFITGSVDFAGTDAPLSENEVAMAKDPVLQIPSTAGMIVLAYNLSGFKGDLKLPRDLYPDILAGNVQYWDDPRLQAANPDAKLPHRSIAVAARMDSSGTTYALSRHLGAISSTWRDSGPGVGKLVSWRSAMLARGNEGVAHLIKISDDIIGYVEYGFAARLGLPMAMLENGAGRFVRPTDEAGRATIEAASGEMPDDLRAYLADPTGEASYPIITLSWLLLRERYHDPAKASVIKEFVGWGLTEGQEFSVKLGYMPLPEALKERAQRMLAGVS